MDDSELFDVFNVDNNPEPETEDNRRTKETEKTKKSKEIKGG